MSCLPKCMVNLFIILTLPETNIASENGWLEDDCFLFGMASWQVRTVSFREGNELGCIHCPVIFMGDYFRSNVL